MKLISILSIFLIIISCGGADDRKLKYLEKSKAYFQEGKLNKARVEIKNVIQIDPKFSEAYYLTGMIEDELSNNQKAFAAFMKAVELDPKNYSARVMLTRYQSRIGLIDKAKENLKILKKQNINNDHLFVESLILMKEKKYSNAKNILLNMIENNAVKDKEVLLLSDIYIVDGKADEAIELLEKHTGSDDVDSKLVALLVAAKKYNKAESILMNNIAKSEMYSHSLNLALLYKAQKKLDLAESTLNEAIKRKPEDVKRYLGLAEFYKANNQQEKAVEFLDDAIIYLDDEGELQLVNADMLMDLGRQEEAIVIFKSIIKKQGFRLYGQKARNMWATLNLKAGDVDEALALIDEILVENSSNLNALMTRSAINLQKKQYENVVNDLRLVLKFQPDNLRALHIMTSALFSKGEKGLAINALENAVDISPEKLDIRLLYINVLRNTENIDKLIYEIEKAEKTWKQNLDIMLFKGQVYMNNNQFDNAQLVYKEIKKKFPDEIKSYQALSRIYYMMKKYDMAENELRESLKLDKNNAGSLTALITTLVTKGEIKNAISELKNILDENPSNLIAMELLGDVYLKSNNTKEAETTWKKVISLKPDWMIPYQSLGALYMQQGKVKAAQELYKNAVSVFENNERLIYLYAQSLEKGMAYEKAKIQYRVLIEKNNKNILAVNNLVSLLLDHPIGNEDIAEAGLYEATLKSINNDNIKDTLGWLYVKQGLPEKSIILFNSVLMNSPDNSTFNYHIGVAYAQMDNAEQAKTYLNKALNHETTQIKKDKITSALHDL